jgi:glycerol-3-phosphate dehydrogenase (NAD(P)+)
VIAVLGAGAFGTALAVALSREGREVVLWARDAQAFAGGGARRLPGVSLPSALQTTTDLARAAQAETVLLALPAQALAGFLALERARLDGKALVACCKGIDLATGLGPVATLAAACPRATAAILTGPSFAADIAQGLPTALTLACADPVAGEALQHLLSTPVLRLYRSEDVRGAELGGALKNVIALAAGIVIGAGLGASARAALMTRGQAEMVRLAVALGARAETLAGLSGFGDLVLTCTSDQSRNFRAGLALGRGQPVDASATVEGLATARAAARLATRHGIDVPVTAMVAALTCGALPLDEAIAGLMSRPLRKE